MAIHLHSECTVESRIAHYGVGNFISFPQGNVDVHFEDGDVARCRRRLAVGSRLHMAG